MHCGAVRRPQPRLPRCTGRSDPRIGLFELDCSLATSMRIQCCRVNTRGRRSPVATVPGRRHPRQRVPEGIARRPEWQPRVWRQRMIPLHARWQSADRWQARAMGREDQLCPVASTGTVTPPLGCHISPVCGCTGTSTSSAAGSLSPGPARSSRFVPSPAGSSSARARLRSSATGPGTSSTGQPLAATTTWAMATPAGMSRYSPSRCHSAPVASNSGQSMTGRSVGPGSRTIACGRSRTTCQHPQSSILVRIGRSHPTQARFGLSLPSIPVQYPAARSRISLVPRMSPGASRTVSDGPSDRLPDGAKIPRAAASCVPISCQGSQGGPYGSGSTA